IDNVISQLRLRHFKVPSKCALDLGIGRDLAQIQPVERNIQTATVEPRVQHGNTISFCHMYLLCFAPSTCHATRYPKSGKRQSQPLRKARTSSKSDLSLRREPASVRQPTDLLPAAGPRRRDVGFEPTTGRDHRPM